MVLAIAIVGVWWYRRKNSKNKNSQPTAPLVEKLPSSLPSPDPTKTVSMTYNVDPPGYTEKNAYFGIKSPLASYITLGPSASEKGPLPPA